MYVITWETNFGEQLDTRGSTPIPASLTNDEQPSTAEANTGDASENEMDYVITSDESNLADRASHRRNKRLIDDVTTRNATKEQSRNEELDWPNPAISPETHEKSLPDMADSQKDEEILPHENFRTKSDAQNSPKRGDDIIVPEISENDAKNESLSPRGGKYNLRPNPNPNYSEDFRY